MKTQSSRVIAGLAAILSMALTVSLSVSGFASDSPEDTPVLFTDMPTTATAKKPGPNAVPWNAPDYSKQETALGYSATAFQVPVGMEERVAFWKDIYTKYTTDQGVFHDSLYTNVFYEPVDFAEIMKDTSLSLKEREKARRKKVEETRKAIRERLVRLQGLSNADGLEGEDLRYWKMFEKVDVPTKFKEASVDGRLRFQLGQKDRFIEGIYQSGRYLAQMEQIFREEGVPVELTRLPFVESSFNLKARSRVGASGIWQFMRSAARPYMHMGVAVDERNDPLTATRAAAKKMRSNYQMLETWPLAVTAYNRGPSGVKRLVDKFKTRNLPDLLDVRKGRFGFAGANFYASFLAALEVEQEAMVHFGVIYRMPEMKGSEIKLKRSLSAQQLLTIFEGQMDLARDYNPHLLDRTWKGHAVLQPKMFVRVPLDRYDQALALIENPVKPAVAQESSKQAEAMVSDHSEEYIVVAGDTLSGIANQFGLRVKDLLDANDNVDPRNLRVGQKLLIPSKTYGHL